MFVLCTQLFYKTQLCTDNINKCTVRKSLHMHKKQLYIPTAL